MSTANSELMEVGEDNNRHFTYALEEEGGDMDRFLHNHHLRFPLFPSKFDWDVDPVSVTSDFDGIVVEVSHLSALKLRVPYLTLPNFNITHTRSQYHILKKHVNWVGTSAAFREAYKNCRGVSLGHVDGGYVLSATLVPVSEEGFGLFDTSIASALCVANFNKVRHKFIEALRTLGPEDMSRPSMQKNHLSNPAYFNILAQDQEFILGLLDGVLTQASLEKGIGLLLTVCQFGEKSTNALKVGDIVDVTRVRSISVHSALTLVPRSPKLHLMWSRSGLERHVGCGGRFFPALSCSEAANFQTSFDGKKPDAGASNHWKDVLRSGKVKMGKLRFFQAYTDSPHTHLTMRWKHPVSGAVATLGVLHMETNKAINVRAREYLDLVRDLHCKFTTSLACRLEAVHAFGGSEIPAVLHPSDVFHDEMLMSMLCVEPIIIPFVSGEDGSGFVDVVRKTISHLLGILEGHYQASKGRGGFKAAWESYQAECAVEELVYGHTLAQTDTQLSKVLGTSATDEKSLTYTRGFLGLCVWNVATSEVSPPPLQHWTGDKRNHTRIRNLFPLTECLSASDTDIGEALWNVLLRDLRRDRYDITLESLCQKEVPDWGKAGGFCTLDSLLDKVGEKDSCPFPQVFNRAKAIVREAGKDPVKCLRLAFASLKIVWFPSVKLWQAQRHPRAQWDRKTYEQVLQAGQNPTGVARLATVKGFVLKEMERRNLIYTSRIERLMEVDLPWIEKCERRLPADVDSEGKVLILTFLSAVALIENQYFVSYEALGTLRDALPVSPARMQELLLLSKYVLPKGAPFKLWKLHETIPTRLRLPQATHSVVAPPTKVARTEEQEDLTEVQELGEHELPAEASETAKRTRFLAPGIKTKWSPQELDHLKRHPDMSNQQAYNAYLLWCEQEDRPARSFTAYRLKRVRATTAGESSQGHM